MKKILLYAALSFPLFAFGENFKIRDGLYYSYWVYKDKGALKEYGNLSNSPRKEMGRYVLTPTLEYTAADEIYMQVKNGEPVLYYYHVNVGAGYNTIGWADAKFSKNNMVIAENTIQMVTEDTKEHIVVGDEFSGKSVRLETDEIAPLRLIDDNTFEVDCNKYLNVNGYKDNGIPDYEEPDPKGRKDIGLSYPATVFSVSEIGICAAFLDDDIVPQIKKGWIQFRRLN